MGELDGILVINKPQGFTSHDVVAKCRRIFQQKKIGHTGTLDPMATGVLPLCFGKATRLSSYLSDQGKSYFASAKLGVLTDTLDSTGKIIEKMPVPQINRKQMLDVINQFVGHIEQTPPMYSAIKIKGKKLYELARQGKSVDIPSRKVEIYNLELIEWDGVNFSFSCRCSKGTYIRSLIRDIGERLGSCATMTSLKRTSVGSLTLNEAITFDELELLNHEEQSKLFCPLDIALSNLPKINLKLEYAKRACFGQRLKIDFKEINFNDKTNCAPYDPEIEVAVYYKNFSGSSNIDPLLIGIGRVSLTRENDSILSMKKVLIDGREID